MTGLLAVRVGNTHTTVALMDGTDVRSHWRLSSPAHRTADEWAVLVRGLLDGAGSAPDGIAVASAVPSVTREWREMIATHFDGLPNVFVEPGTRSGIPVLTDNPREVGADRICNAVAAVSRWGGPAVVVDLGTATTFDVVNSAGQYVGGAIAPGIEISRDALASHAAQLHQVELRRPSKVVAKNTVEALQSGILLGTAALVDGMVARILAELGASGAATVAATGHLAPLVAAECRSVTDHAPWLTLEGLALVFARNRS